MTRTLLPLLLLTGFALAADPTPMKKPDYPSTEKENTIDRLHGVEIPDPYRWLENADDAKVKQWVERENQFTRSVLEKIPGREKNRERLNQLLDTSCRRSCCSSRNSCRRCRFSSS